MGVRVECTWQIEGFEVWNHTGVTADGVLHVQVHEKYAYWKKAINKWQLAESWQMNRGNRSDIFFPVIIHYWQPGFIQALPQ